MTTNELQALLQVIDHELEPVKECAFSNPDIDPDFHDDHYDCVADLRALATLITDALDGKIVT